MEKIKVIEKERYRDVDTIVYQNELNRLYYMWYPTKKIYNQMPRFAMNSNGPKPYVKEVNVELDIVGAMVKVLPSVVEFEKQNLVNR